MEKIIGIDPGITGGIAVFVNNKLVSLHTIPKIKDKVDYSSLINLWNKITTDDTIVILEEVHSIYGSSAKSNFSFGKIYGILIGMIISSQLPYILVQPKEWQKKVWSTQDMVYKTGKPSKDGTPRKTVDTKATSLLSAKRLFPTTDFKATSRSTTPHDGLVDACLIAKSYYI